MKEADKKVRYFIPILDEFLVTGIGYYVISATVEEDSDPEFRNIDIFQKLHVVGPKEVKEKWRVFPRQFFIEVFNVNAEELSIPEFMKLYHKYGKAYIADKTDSEQIKAMVDRYNTDESTYSEKKFYQLYCNGEATEEDINYFIDVWKNSEKTEKIYEFLGLNWRQYYTWVTERKILKIK